MDCFLTYNLSCVNGTFVQFNSSSVVLGDVLEPSVINSGDSLNNDLTSSTNQPIPSSILVSVQHCIFTALILGAIILATITGNIFVIAAVKLEKSLHSVAYYLFVSLAVADLMVASMVSH
jgi:5-hydroxytryptamine receptor 1